MEDKTIEYRDKMNFEVPITEYKDKMNFEVVSDNNEQFDKDTWYRLQFKLTNLIIDGKKFDKPLKSIIEYYIKFDKKEPINYHTILLKTIRYPTSFWKMCKLWRQNKRNGLCR